MILSRSKWNLGVICLLMARLSDAVIHVDSVSCSSHGQAVMSGVGESAAIINDICTLNWASDKLVKRMFLSMYGTESQMNIQHVRARWESLRKAHTDPTVYTIYCNDAHIERRNGVPYDKKHGDVVSLPDGQVWTDWKSCIEQPREAYTIYKHNDIILCRRAFENAKGPTVQRFRSGQVPINKVMDPKTAPALYRHYDTIDAFSGAIAGVIIHELTHTRGGGSLKDSMVEGKPSYGYAQCWMLARQHEARSLDNPDSDRIFGIAIYLRMHADFSMCTAFDPTIVEAAIQQHG